MAAAFAVLGEPFTVTSTSNAYLPRANATVANLVPSVPKYALVP